MSADMALSVKRLAVVASVVIGLVAFGASIVWYRYTQQERVVRIWERIAVDTTPQDEVDRKLRQLAGIGAAYCGHAQYGDAGLSIRCALNQFSRRKPFYVRISMSGFDNWGSTAFAGDSNGKLYFIRFENKKVFLDHPQADAQFFYNGAAVVLPCPTPSYLRAFTPKSLLPIFDPPADPWWIRWPSNLLESARHMMGNTDNRSLLTCFPDDQQPSHLTVRLSDIVAAKCC
jgi:hypothetical protein